MATSNYTTNELMAVTASRLLQDGQNVVVGLGLPQVATLLAKNTHAPNLNMIYEIGVVNADSVDAGVGIADPRLWYRNEYFTGFIGTLGSILQKGMVDVGFLGALQVDQFGNLNSTLVATPKGIIHFTGSGGAADIASYSKNIFVIMKHEKRKIVAALDYLTSAGYLQGGNTRKESGLPACRGIQVITNLCVFGVNKDANVLEVQSIHPGITGAEVVANTGFPLEIAPGIPVTEEPGLEELELLRNRIDPAGLFIK